ncbi:centriole, cilia and spindle-associated protein [Spea bombifrons]|uniref:centriole, cilia and spindle-associated protein n=1 Tax=Spea bombifrons TaxID=233779 RepID=UPI00234A6C53|nr:centriole, cilia and spindle-associated protein [Spea bombifrons]XP_053314473.1 centriole, cilia and spindle-associated protein [Spea bombifrons]
MHCKKLRSEYMKRFKDPQWDACCKCYEDMLKYRVTRRLLEHAHNPWLWEGWDEASDSSSGQSTPPKPSDPAPAPHKHPQSAPHKPLDPSTAPSKLQETEGGALGQPEVNNRPRQTEGQNSTNSNQKHIQGGEGETVTEEKPIEKEKSSRQQHNQSASSRWDGQKSNRSPQRKEVTKENRHPFALYACGEKKKDTGSQKTHNVFAPTQENEIHESALRARNRRQKERRKQILQKQRARSADAETLLRRRNSPVDNPWMTEYMRCFSARGR